MTKDFRQTHPFDDIFCFHLYPVTLLLRSIDSNYVSVNLFIYGSSGISRVLVNNENILISELRERSEELLGEKTQLSEQLSALTEEKEKLIQGNCFAQTNYLKDYVTLILPSIVSPSQNW